MMTQNKDSVRNQQMYNYKMVMLSNVMPPFGTQCWKEQILQIPARMVKCE